MSPSSKPSASHAQASSRADEAEALRHLHLVHRPVLLAYVVRLTKGDRQWAEDIVQETMTRAWRHPDARIDNGHWSRSWLCTIARNILIDNVRAAQSRPVTVFDERLDDLGNDKNEIGRMLDSREVREAIAELPERLRTVLIELYFLDRTVAEAAELLDVPPGTVKSRSFHALRALRENLLARGFIQRAERPV